MNGYLPVTAALQKTLVFVSVGCASQESHKFLV